MRSDRTLLRWFRLINHKFFNNELPQDTCVRWADETDIKKDARCEDKYFGWADTADSEDRRHTYVIVLSREQNSKWCVRIGTLAHEMCHIATKLKDSHGAVFESQRQLIADRGIFKKHALRKGLTLF